MDGETRAEMARLWAEGVPVASIAKAVHYSPQYVRAFAYRNRDEFPRRLRHFPREEREAWAARVLSCELTVAEAARLSGASEQSVRVWVERSEHGWA